MPDTKDLEGQVVVAVPRNSFVFHRTNNGWVVDYIGFEGEDIQSSVYEDPEGESLGAEEALANALWESFPEYFRSKWSGGLVLTVEKRGAEEEPPSDSPLSSLSDQLLRGK